MELKVVALFLLAVAWVTVPAAGLWLLGVGLRGRVIDRRPRCRGCDYLLVGFQSRPARCPECGAGLDGPGRVVLGRRSPRPGLSALGAAMILAAACPFLARALRPGAAVAAAAVVAGAVPRAAAPPPRATRSGPVMIDAARTTIVRPEAVVATTRFTVHALFGVDALMAGVAVAQDAFAGPAPSSASASAGRWAPPPAPGATREPAVLTIMPRRPALTGPVPERRVGSTTVASKVEPRRVGERRIGPWRHPLNSASPVR